jgi:hypothetical protein
VLRQWLSDEESLVIFPVVSPVLLEMSRCGVYEAVENDCEAEQKETHLLNSSAVLAFADAAEELCSLATKGTQCEQAFRQACCGINKLPAAAVYHSQ